MTRTQKLANLLCVGLCAYFLASFLFVVLANYFPGPFYDYWVDIGKIERFFKNPASLSLQELLATHNNAHRLFIPRILFILDYLLADGTNLLLISTSILCKFITLLLFNLNIQKQTFQQKIWLNAIFFAGIFSVGNISNIMMSSNIQWDLMLVFSFLALYFFQKENRPGSLMLAFSCLFMAASFLSHGASLAIPLVFLLHSLMIRDRKLTFISTILLAIVILLHFVILPGWTGEKTDSVAPLIPILDAGQMLPWVIHLVNFILHFMHAPVRHLGIAGFYFSLVYLYLFFVCWQQYRKNPQTHRFFPLLSIFLFIAICIIAAGRVTTNPDFYWASQYEPIAIMFIVAVSAAILINPPQRYARWLKIIAISHCLFMLVWNQLQPYPYGFYRSNKALDSHAYMFMFDRDQYQGDGLKIWVMDPDPVKAIDPFFDKHNFAYYHNKQGGEGRYQHFIHPGEVFISADELSDFTSRCTPNTAAIDYQVRSTGKYIFFTPVNLQQSSYLGASLHRNSYYVLDKNGVVIGFSFVFMSPDSLWPKPILKGLVNTQEAAYIAEVIDEKASCRYALTSPQGFIHDGANKIRH